MIKPATLTSLIYSLIIDGRRVSLDKSKSTSLIITSLFKNFTNAVVNMEYNDKKVYMGLIARLNDDLTVNMAIMPQLSDYFVDLIKEEDKKGRLPELFVNVNVSFKESKYDMRYVEVESVKSAQLTVKFVETEREMMYHEW